MDTLPVLPPEVYVHIFRFLPNAYTLCNVAASCPLFCRLLRHVWPTFNRQWAIRAYRQAASSGNLTLLCWLDQCDIHLEDEQDNRATLNATRLGRIDVLQHLFHHRTLCPLSVLAAEPGKEVVDWLLLQYPFLMPLAEEGCRYALAQQNWLLLCQLVDHFQLPPQKLFLEAACLGGVPMLQLLEARYRAVYRWDWDNNGCMWKQLSARGKLDVLQYIHSRMSVELSSSCFITCLCEAIQYQRLDVIRWLWSTFPWPTDSDVVKAAQPVDQRYLRGLRKTERPLFSLWPLCLTRQEFVNKMARAGCGNMDFMRWLLETESFPPGVLEALPANCHVLLYLFRAGYISKQQLWTKGLGKALSHCEPVSTFQQLVTAVGQECRWSGYEFHHLMQHRRNLSLLQWLFSNGVFRTDEDMQRLYFYCSTRPHTWEWLHSVSAVTVVCAGLQNDWLIGLMDKHHVADVQWLQWLESHSADNAFPNGNLLAAVLSAVGCIQTDKDITAQLEWLWSRFPLSPEYHGKKDMLLAVATNMEYRTSISNLSALKWLRARVGLSLKELCGLMNPSRSLSILLHCLTIFGCDRETGSMIAQKWLPAICGWWPQLSAFQKVVEFLLGAGIEKSCIRANLPIFMLKFCRRGNLAAIQYLHQCFQITHADVRRMQSRWYTRTTGNYNYILRWLGGLTRKRGRGEEPSFS